MATPHQQKVCTHNLHDARAKPPVTPVTLLICKKIARYFTGWAYLFTVVVAGGWGCRRPSPTAAAPCL